MSDWLGISRSLLFSTLFYFWLSAGRFFLHAKPFSSVSAF